MRYTCIGTMIFMLYLHKMEMDNSFYIKLFFVKDIKKNLNTANLFSTMPVFRLYLKRITKSNLNAGPL